MVKLNQQTVMVIRLIPESTANLLSQIDRPNLILHNGRIRNRIAYGDLWF